MSPAALAGKTFLHLGGGSFQVPAIECAAALGCRVITADNRPDNPGHGLAQHYENVSTVDKEGILDVARRHAIDGVMTYGSDVSAPAVCYVSEQLALPGNPFSSAILLQRKDLFRMFQKTSGLPHPKFVGVTSADQARSSLGSFSGKLVAKPADSSGSRGQSVLSSAAEIDDAFDRAICFSRCGVVVFEEFLESDILELDGDILVQGGRLAFRHYGHNYFRRDAPVAVPCGEIFPGTFSAEISEQLDEQFRTLISDLGIRIGCMNFDGVVSNGTPYILDIGLRNGGNFVPELIRMSTGFDLTRAAVLAALGQEESCQRLHVDEATPVASYILNSLTAGVYGGFELSDEIREYYCAGRLFTEEGADVLPFTQGNRALGVLFFRFPDMRTLRAKMEGIEEQVVVSVEPGPAGG